MTMPTPVFFCVCVSKEKEAGRISKISLSHPLRIFFIFLPKRLLQLGQHQMSRVVVLQELSMDPIETV